MSRPEQELLDIYTSLTPTDQSAVLAFARFLAHQGAAAPAQASVPAETTALQEPVAIPRPAQETVVGALKRLTSTYPMLDKAKLLNQTSGVVAQHVMHGRDLVETINELEQIFRDAYAKYRNQ